MRNCVTKRTYQYLINKIRTKHNNWDASKFSLVGRGTLAQSTLLLIPTYTMKTSYLTESICANIDKLSRNFIWGSNDNCRKVNFIPWSQVLLSKEMGESGFRDAKIMNMAFLLKLAWGVVSSLEGLWVCILRTKYKIIELLPEHVKIKKASNV